LLRFLSSASVSVGLPPTNERAQTRNRPGGIRVSLDRQCAAIGPLIVVISEGVENGGGGSVEDGPGGGVVLELRDAVDHEIVGESLKTSYRDGIAVDIMRPGYAASGVAATSLEITRRSRLSRG
jgi:hypothetical protein